MKLYKAPEGILRGMCCDDRLKLQHQLDVLVRHGAELWDDVDESVLYLRVKKIPDRYPMVHSVFTEVNDEV